MLRKARKYLYILSFLCFLACIQNSTAKVRHTKCALKPGRSLMDWIRLGLSETDLSGRKGVIHPVSFQELAEHSRENDAWISIRGRVFNVTHYMEFHPGGKNELMRGAGKDATKLFEDIHPWVNFEQMLAKCYIGPLTNVSTTCFSSSNFKNEKKNAVFLAPDTPDLKIPTAKAPSESQRLLCEKHSNISRVQKLPYRFDWIQKLKEVTLVLYTTPFSNPSIILRYLNESVLELDLILTHTTYEFRFKLFGLISWPCLTKVYDESGKIEVMCSKEQERLWPHYGELESNVKQTSRKVEYEFEKTCTKNIAKNSFAVSVQPKFKVIMHFGVGNYVMVSDIRTRRSYTPVPAIFAALEPHNQSIYFLVKRYDAGHMSKVLTSEESCLLYLSEPKGDFPLSLLKDHCRIALIAAGSGITPMLSVIQHLLRRSFNKVECIHLVYINRSVQDIWCHEELEKRMLIDHRLRTKYFLTQMDKACHEKFHQFSEEAFSAHLLATEKPSFICLCGPKGFNETMIQMLEKKGICKANMYIFQ